MGGNAFAADGIYTPRMPSRIYRAVLDDILIKLRTIYPQVVEPLEAPGKSDHGDIDVLVVAGEPCPTHQQVAELLGAVAFKRTTGSSTANFAMPWPANDPIDTTNAVTCTEVAVEEMQPRYIQVDINHNRDAEEMRFTQFLHAHGDAWVILSAIIRPYGLTCTNEGLHIRIQEIESIDRKKARVWLTKSPDQILTYLGLDSERFWTPFATMDECMDYISTCRFFDPQRRLRNASELTLRQIKAEQKKHDQRVMFAYWLDEYLPAHQDVATQASVDMTRNDVMQEAKRAFGHLSSALLLKQL